MNDEMMKQLAAPFPPDKVSWRPGTMTKDKKKAMALAYIDSRDVQQRLDDVCGPLGWQNTLQYVNNAWVSSIGILREDGVWVWKTDGSDESDIEASKGGISGALKRAAVLWGIGRYLYRMESPWVELDEYKRIKPDSLKRLQKMLPKTPSEGHTRPSEAQTPKKEVDTPTDTKTAQNGSQEPKADIPPFKGPWYKAAKEGGPKGFLEICAEQKARIGERLYYDVLIRYNLEKANKVDKKDRQLQGKLLHDLKQFPDFDTMEGQGEVLKSQIRQVKEMKQEELLLHMQTKIKALGGHPDYQAVRNLADDFEVMIAGAETLISEGIA